MQYFGHVGVPAGAICAHCEEAIHVGERGFSCPNGDGRDSFFHYACFLRLTLGSVGHQMKQCSCHGMTDISEEGLSRREAAARAVAFFEETRA